jgi:hypothetical protein
VCIKQTRAVLPAATVWGFISVYILGFVKHYGKVDCFAKFLLVSLKQKKTKNLNSYSKTCVFRINVDSYIGKISFCIEKLFGPI